MTSTTAHYECQKPRCGGRLAGMDWRCEICGAEHTVSPRGVVTLKPRRGPHPNRETLQHAASLHRRIDQILEKAPPRAAPQATTATGFKPPVCDRDRRKAPRQQLEDLRDVASTVYNDPLFG